MIIKRLLGSTLHEHPDASQRVLGVAELPPDSDELAALLAADPSPQVRAAAAARCTNLGALTAAWRGELDSAVRDSLAEALGSLLAQTPQGDIAKDFLDGDDCTDAIRAEVARRTQDGERRRIAIAAIRDEGSLVALALVAERSETRLGAAERVWSPDGLHKLADGARDKDRGVARLARTRIEAIQAQARQAAEAEEVLAQLESLATSPLPVLTAMVELDRRWQALPLAHDAARVARWDAAQRVLRARLDREQEEHQARMRFDRRLGEMLARRECPATSEALADLRDQLASLRLEASTRDDPVAVANLQDAEQRFDGWARELEIRAHAEALVVEAERLAGANAADNAGLAERWQALEQSVRTPALTRRFEAALMRIEQHRLTLVQAADRQASAARHALHGALHAAEQALGAGQVHAARAALEEIRALKPEAGMLPKPTIQRLGRLAQQLTDLERWESFGQQHARVQLCERAEALPSAALDAPRLAAEVRKLREAWKALDQQHAGVPKALWERFDGACETAYAPAARHFAELAAQRDEARRKRREFIDAAAARAAQWQQEPRDWRAIEHWLRDTDRAWRTGDLGSVEPKAWGKLDARFRAAVAGLRDALAQARTEAKSSRQRLIDEATALAGKAMERDAPARVKELQSRWQAQAREIPLAHHDEQVLWHQFRAACNAVFEAREAKRKDDEAAKQDVHRSLRAICDELEQLAVAPDREDAEVRRRTRELEAQWKKQAGDLRPASHGIETRFRSARAAVENALASRSRARDAAVWTTLAAKERLCEELDRMALTRGVAIEGAATDDARGRWDALPALPRPWETRMLARRDAALGALAADGAARDYASRIEQGIAKRREILLELEIALGLDSPAELRAQRLAFQVGQLKRRFHGAERDVGPRDTLLAWCAEPGVADERDRLRCEKAFAAIART